MLTFKFEILAGLNDISDLVIFIIYYYYYISDRVLMINSAIIFVHTHIIAAFNNNYT